MGLKMRVAGVLLSWTGIFLLVLGVNLVVPITWWGALLALPYNFAVVPGSCFAAIYFLQGPEEAARWWRIFRFVLANWYRPKVLAAYGEGKIQGRGETR